MNWVNSTTADRELGEFAERGTVHDQVELVKEKGYQESIEL